MHGNHVNINIIISPAGLIMQCDMITSRSVTLAIIKGYIEPNKRRIYRLSYRCTSSKQCMNSKHKF